ncbi:hypothetical protein PBRA_005589 [Plasmodiophora brassicae]|uniref:Uncharacterized protein n=1 Tax=Plasmodiophora brassicae TaxID=37360 RepID=A0A0G4IP71_PLABS|nr:hypothetical protein PBRA_005589 [Plasmodiophora brassicae]
MAGHSIAARGQILPLGQIQFWERTRGTRTRVLVQIEEVIASAAASKYPIGSSRSLGSFGECPFTLLVDVSSLRPRSMPIQSDHVHTHDNQLVDSPDSPESRYDEPVQCCLQDVFHLMKRVKVKKSHHFYSLYVITWNQDDLAKVEASLRACGEDPLYWRVHRRDYLLRGVRRRIPVPSVLRGRVQEACGHFANLLNIAECRCSTIGRTEIFRTCLSTLTKVVVAILTETTTSSIRRIGVGPNGLTLYRCSRGTNCCESNHRVLKKKFGSLDAGIALTEALMLQHVLRTNVRAAENHRPGHYKIGHFHS